MRPLQQASPIQCSASELLLCRIYQGDSVVVATTNNTTYVAICTTHAVNPLAS